MPNTTGKAGSSHTGGSYFAAHSQVFLHPFSPNTAGSGPAETSRSREQDHSRSTMGRGWETWGQPPRLAVWGRKHSTARVTSVPLSWGGRGADPAKPFTADPRATAVPSWHWHQHLLGHTFPTVRRGQARYTSPISCIFALNAQFCSPNSSR